MAAWTMQCMPSLMGVYSMRPNPAASQPDALLTLPGAAPEVADISIASITAVGDIPVRPGAVNASLALRFDPGTRIASFYILNNIAPRDQAAVRELHELYRKTPGARRTGLVVGHYRFDLRGRDRYRTAAAAGPRYRLAPAYARGIALACGTAARYAP